VWYGIQKLTDADATCRPTERNLGEQGMPAERTSNCDKQASTSLTTCFLVAGLLVAMSACVYLHGKYKSRPDPLATTVTVDGHPATPEEQRALLDYINQQNSKK